MSNLTQTVLTQEQYRYRLTQEQYDWLYRLATRELLQFVPSWELTKAAFGILLKCGHTKVYSEDDRTVLIQIVELYKEERDNKELPF